MGGCLGGEQKQLDPKDFAKELGCTQQYLTPQKNYETLGLPLGLDSTVNESTGKPSVNESSGKPSGRITNENSLIDESSLFSCKWESQSFSEDTEFNGIPWSKLKLLRRNPEFNKREFLHGLSKEEKV